MKTLIAASSIWILLTVTVFAEKMQVTGDRVNVRASSNLASRVMGQVSRGTVLEASHVSSNWVSILPPPNVFAWVHKDIVKNDRVTVPSANIRSGPGINYEILSRVEKGTSLHVHAAFNEWLKISPPDGTLLWISKDYVKALSPPPPAMPKVKEPETTNATARINVGVAPRPPMPEDGDLRPSSPSLAISPQPLSASGITSNMLETSELQNVELKKRGILKRASKEWRRPSRYVLVDPNSKKEDKTLCYVTGSDPQLDALVEKEMTIEGTQFIVQGAKYPVFAAQKIILHQ